MWPDLGRWAEFDGCRDQALPPSRREQRQLAFAGLKQLLRRLARRGPLVLIVDDLQWADLDSARLLLELLGPPEAPALLYVGSYRSEEEQRSEFLRELLLDGAAAPWQCERQTIELGPFDETGAAAMAMTLLADRVVAPELAAARIARESGGLPFFVSELAAYFLEELSGDETHLSLSQLLGRRLAALGATERRTLELLALARRPVSQEVLGVALEDVARCARAVRVLSLRGLVHTDAENRVVTYHDRLREQVAQDIPQAEAAALHRLLARAYERTLTVEPEWLIEHWLGGGEAECALDCAVAAAARASAKLAFNRAAALYRTALELLHADDPRRSELSAKLGEALVNAGRGTDAARAFLEGVDGADADAAYTLRCRAAQQYLRYGRTAEATDLLERLFGELGERYPRSAPEVAIKLLLCRGRLALRSLLHIQIGRGGERGRRRLLLLESSFRECAIADPLRGLLFQSLFYEEALRVGDSQAAFIGLAWGMYFLACVARAGERRSIARKLEQLEAEAARLKTSYLEGTALLVSGAAALFQGDYRRGGELTSRAQAIFREQCPGAAFEESTCALLRYTAVENVGPLSSLCQEMPALVRRASERQDELSDALLATHFGAALLVQDRPEQAIEFLLSRRVRLGDAMSMQLVAVAVQLSDAYAYSGNATAAFDTIERIRPAYLRSGYDRMNFICMVINLRRAHAALLLYARTRDPTFACIVETAARRLERMRRPDADTMAEGFRAGLAAQRSQPAEARQRMRRALALTEFVGIPVTGQCYRFQLGRVTPGAEGAQLTAEADAALRAEGVVAPERWVNIYVTGFEAS
jgi:hypothetical protein